MQSPGLPHALVAGLNAVVVKPWVVYLPPPLTEDDEASFHSIPMEDDEASFHSIPMEDDEASFHSIPMEDVEASIPMEHVRDGTTRLNAGSRKAAKRTFPWDLSVEEINLASPPPQDEDEAIHAAKRPRLETPLPTSTDEATTTNTPHTATVAVFQDDGIALPAAADHADSDPVMDMHPKSRAATRSWTPQEDANLTIAIQNTDKNNTGQKYQTDWIAISALVPGRTNTQCRYRWHHALDPSIDRSIVRTGQWTVYEDKKLKEAVRSHGAKNWFAVAALVPGRSSSRCRYRWDNFLHPSIDRSIVCAGKWTADEDKKLKEAVRSHGAKKWSATAALVPGRTSDQCNGRWHNVLDPSIDRSIVRAGKWTADEDKKLKEAVRSHGARKWVATAALVPGRTSDQCRYRWYSALNPSIDRSAASADG
jgi:hypothetical protein